MNREEKHQLVIKLFKEGKPMREIAKEVHMSFGDIGSITRKENEDKEPKSMEKSQESQALKLFRKGKNPVDVAITLDLSPSDTAELYKQFWRLRGLHNLLKLFEAINRDTSFLSRVNDVVKKYDLTKRDIINIVNFADEYNFLEEEIQEMGEQFKDLLRQRHETNDSLQLAKKKLEEITNQIDINDRISIQKKARIENMNNEIKRLETCILELRNGDECYSKFEKFAAEKLEFILKDRRWLLALAIDAVIESMKQDQFKDQFKEIIINDKIVDEINQKKLLDLCEVLFEKILEQLMDVTLQVNSKQISNQISSNFSNS